MKTERFGKHTVMLYETIDELPVDRFTAWNKYMMLDGALGSTFEDIDRLHLSQLTMVIDDKAKALQQITNLRELVFSLVNQVNYQHHAFCCMIYSIDGDLIIDYTDTGIKETLVKLNKIGATNGDIKKKIHHGSSLFTKLWNGFFQNSSTDPRNSTTGLK